MAKFRMLALAIVVLIATSQVATRERPYEVWAIDQSNSPGLTFGGTLYIWDGDDLENMNGGNDV